MKAKDSSAGSSAKSKKEMIKKMPKQSVFASFEAEAVPHLNDLYRTAVRLTRSQADAEDLIQDVYLQAWKSFAKYQPETNCRAWLYKIMFNKFNQQRSKKYVRTKWTIENADEFVFDNAVYEPPISENLSDEEIIAALDNLPLRYRQVVLLADVQEFSYKEIAQILATPIGTVMSRLSRGRGRLKKSLTKVAGEYGIAVAAQAEKQNVIKSVSLC